uniref:Uncharacterized protein n=1 Tax=Rhizophora mucronata TaxID=61149 RepID=A0A2P2PZP7_RHIMU
MVSTINIITSAQGTAREVQNKLSHHTGPPCLKSSLLNSRHFLQSNKLLQY